MLNEKESDNRKIVELSHGAAAEVAVDGGGISMGGGAGTALVMVWVP